MPSIAATEAMGDAAENDAHDDRGNGRDEHEDHDGNGHDQDCQQVDEEEGEAGGELFAPSSDAAGCRSAGWPVIGPTRSTTRMGMTKNVM